VGVVRDGKEVARQVGAVPPPVLQRFTEEALRGQGDGSTDAGG
jgi:hypothetical protein